MATKGEAARTQRDAQVTAANKLLANRGKHRTEGNVQSDIEALLREMGVGTIESHYQQGNQQADIYLPNRRTFIECKAYPKARYPDEPQKSGTSETPKQQVERYVLAEIENELHAPTLPGFSSRQPGGVADVAEADWVGIVTDGSNWTVYRYPHQRENSGYSWRTRS